MPLDDDDKREIAKLFNSAFTAREERASKDREKEVAQIVAAALTANQEAERVRKAEEADKAEKEAAKAKGEEGERVTLTQRVKALEEEKRQAVEEARREKANAKFRSAWGGAKFNPDLADEHMAFLRSSDRLLIDDDGAVRVRDPQKSKHETQPTLEEYVGALAKSDRGKVYQAPAGTAGQGANGVQAHRTDGESRSLADVNEAIFGVRLG